MQHGFIYNYNSNYINTNHKSTDRFFQIIICSKQGMCPKAYQIMLTVLFCLVFARVFFQSVNNNIPVILEFSIHSMRFQPIVRFPLILIMRQYEKICINQLWEHIICREILSNITYLMPLLHGIRRHFCH